MNVLSQAQINEQYNKFVVGGEELHKFYDENKNRYEQVKVKVIYVSFSPNPGQSADGKKRLSEAEAKEKAERLVKEIKGGADFLKLVKENSEDETSKAKDGDFGTLSRADNLPDAIRNTVFTLKAGEISDPVRQPNGYYIFRAEEISQKAYDDVQNQIYSELKNLRLKQWLDTTTKELNIQFVDTDFFAGSGMPGAPPAPAPSPAAKPSLAK
jgi:peptidyl-prolyl cis-trans isomerase C